MMFNNIMLNTMFNLILSDCIEADASVEIQYLAPCLFAIDCSSAAPNDIFAAGLLPQKIFLLLVCLQLIACLPGQWVN